MVKRHVGAYACFMSPSSMESAMALLATTLPPSDAGRFPLRAVDVTPLHSMQRLASAVAIGMTERRQDDLSRIEAPGRRMRVLVIDDAADNRDMFVDFLNVAGFESESAADGQQGIDKVRSFQPDLVVMDSVMPGMSGLTATRMLRAHPAYVDLPIIAVSADATEQHRRDCLQAGASMCLSKPVQLDRLASVIRQLLQAAPTVRSCA
jgi:CheY-like chemotaxis protein